eukprot:6811235-Prymnesium_polylepis.1
MEVVDDGAQTVKTSPESPSSPETEGSAPMLKSKLKPHRSGLKDVLGRAIQQHRERAHSDPVEGEELSTPPPIGGQTARSTCSPRSRP